MWRIKGLKMRLVLELERGGKMVFAAVSSHEINRILECKMGIVGKILDKGMRPSRVFKSQHFYAIKFVP